MHNHDFNINGRVGKITPLNGVLKVSIASTISYKDKQTQKREYDARWNTITIFDDHTAKYIVENITPGDLVQAKGDVYDHNYQKNDETIYTTVLNCRSFVRLAKKAEQEEAKA